MVRQHRVPARIQGKGKTKSQRKTNAQRTPSGIGAIAHTQASSTDSDYTKYSAFKKKDETPFFPKNEKQRLYAESMKVNDLTFGVGCAGTGKTYVATIIACELLEAKQIERIIFARPAVGAGESLGYYKGFEKDKIEPWMRPVIEILNRKLGTSATEYCLEHGTITFQSFETMRGHSWPKTMIILDEAQNTTPTQMKLFLTRTGEGSRVVVDGDFVDQKDINGKSGLEEALEVLREEHGVGYVEFTASDIVRSGFVKRVLLAYQKHKK